MKFTKRLVSLLIVACLAASMIPAALAATPFVDVPNDAWYAQDVEKAYNTGLVNGKSATTYAPYDNLTYSEVIKLAACMHQSYLNGSVSLTNNNGTPWYQTYVDYCKINGIITKDYPWEQTVTRAGYMEIFANALPEYALAAINEIADNAIPDVFMSHPQAEAIYKLYRAGVLQGTGADHLCEPSNSITRSEVAAILTRMMDSAERVLFTLGDVEDLDDEKEEKDDKDDKDDRDDKDDKDDRDDKDDKDNVKDPEPEKPVRTSFIR